VENNIKFVCWKGKSRSVIIIKTGFRFWAFLMLGCFVALSFVLFLFLGICIAHWPVEIPVAVFMMLLMLGFAWLLLLLGELRTKTVVVKMYSESLSNKKFMGLIPAGKYDFKEFDGYRTCLVPSKSGYY
jgi:hypothetical protein